MESKFKTEITEERALEIVCQAESLVCEKIGVAPEIVVEESSSASQTVDTDGEAVMSQGTASESDLASVPTLPQPEAASQQTTEPQVSVSSLPSSSSSTVSSSHPPAYMSGAVSIGPGRGEPRGKQLFNALYFIVSAAVIGATVCYLQLHIIWPVVVFLALAGLLALSCAINNRAHPKDFEVSLSNRTRRLIRASALLLPIPFMLLFTARVPANWEYDQGMKLYDASEYAQAVPHFETALHLNPQYSKAQEMLTYSYFFSDDFQKALTSADIALQAFPDSSALLAEKAYVLNLNGKYEDAIPFAQRATQLDPANGQAFSDLAESNYRLGHFTAALEAANVHVKLHNEEAEAFRSRQSIFDSLGRASEAAADAATASRLDGEQTATDTDTNSETQN